MRDLEAVKNSARELTKAYPKLDLVICNAGVMLEPFQRTVDGFETHYAVNLLAHAALVHHLLPSFDFCNDSSNNNSRIVFVSSATLHLGDFRRIPLGKDDCFTKYSNGYHAYSTSKLAVSLYAEALNGYFEKAATRKQASLVKVISLHPGCVSSSLYRHANFFSRMLIRGPLKPFMRSPVVAAAEVVALALSNNIKGGLYYQHMRPTKILCNVSQQERYHFFEHVRATVKCRTGMVQRENE